LQRKLVIVLAALAVVALAGGAYAATQSSAPPTRQAFLNDVAKRLHVTPQQLTAALNGASADQLQAQVKAGRLTQAQANAIEQQQKKNGGSPAIPFGLFAPGPGQGPGFGPGPGGLAPGPGRLVPGPAIGRGLFGLGSLDSVASYLGLTNAQLFQQLSTGKSLAQIAAARGKSVSGLEQAITSATKSRLDKLVAAKVLTAAQEQKILSHLSSGLAQRINRKGLPGARPNLRWGFGRGPAAPSTPKQIVPPAYVPAPAYPAPTA
jgi:AraC-like DNA-binding protein